MTVKLNARHLRTITSPNEKLLKFCFHPILPDIIATGTVAGNLVFWDILTGERVANFPIHNKPVGVVKFSPDSQVIALTGKDFDKTIKLLEPSSGKLISAIDTQHRYLIHTLAFSPDGKLLASGSDDATVKLWEISSGKLVQTLKTKDTCAVSSLAFCPDRPFLIVGRDGGLINRWNYVNYSLKNKLQILNTHACEVASHELVTVFNGHIEWVVDLNFSHDGRYLVSAGAGDQIILWDTKKWSNINTFNGHFVKGGYQAVNSARFSPNDTLVVSGGLDGVVKIWNVKTGSELHKIIYSHKVILADFHQSGELLVSQCADGLIYIHKLEVNDKF